jgi:hypothetical protein
MLAHISEVDARRLYLPAAYPSMYEYCVGALHMSEDMALKRIQAARVARRFPAAFVMLADGRLHLSGLVLLAPHLTPANHSELLAGASHRSKAGIEALLAERFPRPDVLTTVTGLAPLPLGECAGRPAPGQVATMPSTQGAVCAAPEHAPGQVAALPVAAAPDARHAPGHVERARISPLSSGRYEIRFTFGQASHDKLRHAQALLGHAVPNGDIPAVLDRALDQLIAHLEKRVFAAGVRTRPGPGAPKGRHIPAGMRRAVWQRDGGRCTFVSDSGRRCASCTRLEFDHVTPLARGGETSVANLRLRCRAHNQYAADREFGAGFMRRKRERASAEPLRATRQSVTGPSHARSVESEHAPGHVDRRAHCDEVIPWLRSLGMRAEEARRGAEMCSDMMDAPLEQRVHAALAGLGRARFERSTHAPNSIT